MLFCIIARENLPSLCPSTPVLNMRSAWPSFELRHAGMPASGI